MTLSPPKSILTPTQIAESLLQGNEAGKPGSRMLESESGMEAGY